MNFPWAAEATSQVAPRQLGYESVKFITQLTVTDSLKGFGKGLGTALSSRRGCRGGIRVSSTLKELDHGEAVAKFGRL